MLINMKEMLKVANNNNFAVPAFNISSLPMLNGVFQKCEELQSPVIIEIHPDELSYVGDSFVKTIIDKANKTWLPVVIHLDHGSTLEQVFKAIRDGFTSVMIDASALKFDENVAITKKVVEIAHSLNISVEGELGTIGNDAGDKYGGSKDIKYTEPEEAKVFVEKTGCDSLAIAIGTAHGIYPKDYIPKLKLDLLTEIKKAVNMPLVLHGGSANPDSEIEEAVKRGINKINISSDIKSAFYKKCREILKDENLREPNAIYPECIKSMCEVVEDKINLFDSNNKAKLYS